MSATNKVVAVSVVALGAGYILNLLSQQRERKLINRAGYHGKGLVKATADDGKMYSAIADIKFVDKDSSEAA